MKRIGITQRMHEFQSSGEIRDTLDIELPTSEGKIFNLSEIDLFAFENNQNSFTATRITASYLKGIATALKKPTGNALSDSSLLIDLTLWLGMSYQWSDPLVENWFYVQVSDTLGLTTM